MLSNTKIVLILINIASIESFYENGNIGIDSAILHSSMYSMNHSVISRSLYKLIDICFN